MHLLTEEGKAYCGKEGLGVLEREYERVNCVECVILAKIPTDCSGCGNKLPQNNVDAARELVRTRYSPEQVFALGKTKGGFTLYCSGACPGIPRE